MGSPTGGGVWEGGCASRHNFFLAKWCILARSEGLPEQCSACATNTMLLQLFRLKSSKKTEKYHNRNCIGYSRYVFHSDSWAFLF